MKVGRHYVKDVTWEWVLCRNLSKTLKDNWNCNVSSLSFPLLSSPSLLLPHPRPASSIRLRFNHLSAECQWDYLYVFDGDSVFDAKLAAFTWVVTQTSQINTVCHTWSWLHFTHITPSPCTHTHTCTISPHSHTHPLPLHTLTHIPSPSTLSHTHRGNILKVDTVDDPYPVPPTPIPVRMNDTNITSTNATQEDSSRFGSR